jgi:hypothetical protein
MSRVYSYLWLREDGTPYYAGKGTGRRAFTNNGHRVRCPKDCSRILIFPMADEVEAFESEIALIELFGRKDLGTGCLRNLTDGGDSPVNQGRVTHQKQSIAAKRRANTPEGRANLIRAGCVAKPPRSEEHRQHLREALLGRKASAAQKLHQSLAQKGKPKPPRTQEHIERQAAALRRYWAAKRVAIR